MIEEHGARRQDAGKDIVAKDMVDLLLQLSDDPNLEAKLNYDGVKGFMLVHLPSFHFFSIFIPQ